MPTDEPDLDAVLRMLGEALSTGAPLTTARAHAAVKALTTAAEYLTIATGPAVSASIPTAADLAEVLVGLHITLHRLHAGVDRLHAGIARRAVGAEIPIVDVARIQGALTIAIDRLGTAALTVGAAGDVLVAPAVHG